MTVTQLTRLLSTAENNTAGGVSVTFFTILIPDSILLKMHGYVISGYNSRITHFETEKRLCTILNQLGRK
jgi:hypothetical protein